MSKLTRCENCTGELSYSPQKEMIVCTCCGSSFPIKVKKEKELKRKYDIAYTPMENREVLAVYRCETCGTKSIVGTDNVVRRCSSCGNTSLLKEKTALNTPDGMIPFKVTREKAAEIFRKWVASRKFAPNDLVEMAKLEKLSGFYTPVWNFSYNSIFKYSVIGIKKVLDAYDNEIRRETMLQKVLEDNHENDMHSASTRMDDEILESLGEYNFNFIRPYSTEYLMGFAGLETDVDIHKTYNNIVETIKSENERKVTNKLNDEYDYLEDFSSITRLRETTFYYSYVPVWANHYTYKGKEYHCYINGQTGVATGKSPKSFGKIAATVLGILGGIGFGILIVASIL